jgi:TolA-binding protein
LREGQAARALSVLTSFEQTTEGPGAMQEERSAAATMARCALALRGETQHGGARALFEDFARRYPKSAYAARLERTCLPKSPR